MTIIKKYADQKHKQQAEAFIFAVGQFVIEFERVCEAMRYNIMFSMRSQGLKNQGMEEVVIGDKAAAELRELMGALYCELPNQDEADKEAVRKLLKSIFDLTEKRNILLHSNWQLGSKAAEGEFYASTLRFRKKQNKGAVPELYGHSADYVHSLSEEARRIQIYLSRLQYCICQKGFKISKELSKKL